MEAYWIVIDCWGNKFRVEPWGVPPCVLVGARVYGEHSRYIAERLRG